MSGVFSRRLFPVLQLARLALVFTAISNALCMLFLATALRGGDGEVFSHLAARDVIAVILMSIGLYGFGMSLNDIIDRRRDAQLASHRPLPSGRIGVATAHVVCGLLIAMALAGGSLYATGPAGWMPLIIVVWTAALIVFYDYAGKYLVALGLLSLGLIRFFNATAAAPGLPLIWQPLLLLNHVTLLSLVAYHWEQKRPSLTRVHWWSVIGGLAGIDVLLVGILGWRRWSAGGSIAAALEIRSGLLWPVAAVVVFVIIAIIIRRRSASSREAGQRLMLYGLLWLILYDATFAEGYIGWGPAVVLLALLPAAYFSVQLMRWWGGVIALTHRPAFKRVEI